MEAEYNDDVAVGLGVKKDNKIYTERKGDGTDDGDQKRIRDLECDMIIKIKEMVSILESEIHHLVEENEKYYFQEVLLQRKWYCMCVLICFFILNGITLYAQTNYFYPICLSLAVLMLILVLGFLKIRIH